MPASLTVPSVLRELKKLYKPPKTFLHASSSFELLLATVLSAQCTDDRVNIVTKTLFKKYRKPEDYLQVPVEELQKDIFSCGHYRNKAKFLQGIARMTIENGGEIPQAMEELIRFPGVGRKTAAIILYACFGKHEGIAVDTHVQRLSLRLGLTRQRMPEKIEKELMKKTPREDWGILNTLMISHGRAVCTARNRKCDQCVFKDACPSSFTRGNSDLAHNSSSGTRNASKIGGGRRVPSRRSQRSFTVPSKGQ